MAGAGRGAGAGALILFNSDGQCRAGGWAGGWQLQKRGMRKHKLGGGENGEKRGMVKLDEPRSTSGTRNIHSDTFLLII